MTRTRKHYIEVAATLKRQIDAAQNLSDARQRAVNVAVERIANDLALMFANDNPNFDHARFFKAVGVVA